MVQYNPGVYDAWAITSKEVSKYPISFHKSVSKLLNHLEIDLDTKRIQGHVKEGFDEGCRWLESLGYVKEGLMLQYGPDGANHWLYARVR